MNNLLILLLGHALGDFYFQSNKMVKLKSTKLLSHVILYTVIMLITIGLIDFSLRLLVFGAIIFVSHYLIDLFTLPYKKRYNLIAFLVDQLCHLLVIYVILLMLPGNDSTTSSFLLITVLIMYLMVPTSIFVEKVIASILNEPFQEGFYLDEGTIIGILERFIILVLGIVGNISGVGLLVAAKTMVRYGQFESSNDKKFRSKYLIGTLSSVLVGLVAYAILSRF